MIPEVQVEVLMDKLSAMNVAIGAATLWFDRDKMPGSWIDNLMLAAKDLESSVIMAFQGQIPEGSPLRRQARARPRVDREP